MAKQSLMFVNDEISGVIRSLESKVKEGKKQILVCIWVSGVTRGTIIKLIDWHQHHDE